MPKKICDISSYPELAQLTQDMENTKNEILNEVELLSEEAKFIEAAKSRLLMEADALHEQAKMLNEKKEDIKNRAIASSKNHWNKIESYLVDNYILTEKIDKEKGQNLALSEDNLSYQINDASDSIVYMLKTLQELIKDDKEKEHTKLDKDAKITNKEWMN